MYRAQNMYPCVGPSGDLEGPNSAAWKEESGRRLELEERCLQLEEKALGIVVVMGSQLLPSIPPLSFTLY